jgi:hypothetical protein
MKASKLLLALLVTFCLVYTGCKNSENKTDTGKETAATEQKTGAGEKVEEAVEDVEKKSEEMHAGQVEKLNQKAPEEIAPELWNLIQTEEYQQWKELPGTGMVSKDVNKKVLKMKTYVNDIAYDSMQKKEKTLPPGSILVKERYDDQDQLQTISAMINLGGNDPRDINWFWAQYSLDGKPLKWGETGKGVKSAN